MESSALRRELLDLHLTLETPTFSSEFFYDEIVSGILCQFFLSYLTEKLNFWICQIQAKHKIDIPKVLKHFDTGTLLTGMTL